MLIIASLAAATFATSLAAAAPPASALPPIVVAVTVTANVSPSLVSRVLDETDAVWRASGLSFVWRRTPPSAAPRLDQPSGDVPGTLRIVIGDARGAAHDGLVPLGWIEFDEGVPAREIYLSYGNAMEFMRSAQGIVGIIDQMPTLEREIKLARVMGRALAHELGHYLLASKAHTATGLMQASHSAMSFFNRERHGFEVDSAQRQQLVARLRQDPLVVRR
jgi:hypothetical protein